MRLKATLVRFFCRTISLNIKKFLEMFFSSLALYIEVWEVDQTVQHFFSDVIMEVVFVQQPEQNLP